MSKIPSIGFKRPIRFWTALVFFAVAAGYACENRLVRNRISSLSLDQENLYMLLSMSEIQPSGRVALCYWLVCKIHLARSITRSRPTTEILIS